MYAMLLMLFFLCYSCYSKFQMSQSKSTDGSDLSDATVAEIREATDGSIQSHASVAEIREVLGEGITALLDGALSIRDMNAISSYSAWRDDVEKMICESKEQLLSQITTVLEKHKQLLRKGGVRFQILSDLAVKRLQRLVDSSDCASNLELEYFDTVRDDKPKVLKSSVKNKSTKIKRKRNRESQNVRKNKKKASNAKGGAKEVKGVRVMKGVGKNEETCLRDAILALISSEDKRRKVQDTIDAAMPSEGSTKPGAIDSALKQHGMVLEPVSKQYFERKGMSCEQAILQETDCKLVMRLFIKSKCVKGKEYRHFVAWDGMIVYAAPVSLQIEKSDRATEEGSKQAFNEFYRDYAGWDMKKVWELHT